MPPTLQCEHNHAHAPVWSLPTASVPLPAHLGSRAAASNSSAARCWPPPALQVPGGLDSVSYGPTIRNAHSPDERVQISTVQPFWEATLRILEELADRRV